MDMRSIIDILEDANEISRPVGGKIDPYGYWIMGDGRIIPCKEQAHIDSAMQALGMEPDEYDYTADRDGNEAFSIRYDALQETGSIRITTHNKEVTFDMPNPSKGAAKSALRVLRICKGRIVRFDSEIKKYNFEEAFDYIKKFV